MEETEQKKLWHTNKSVCVCVHELERKASDRQVYASEIVKIVSVKLTKLVSLLLLGLGNSAFGFCIEKRNSRRNW